jgi:hypothetical protein
MAREVCELMWRGQGRPGPDHCTHTTPSAVVFCCHCEGVRQRDGSFHSPDATELHAIRQAMRGGDSPAAAVTKEPNA